MNKKIAFFITLSAVLAFSGCQSSKTPGTGSKSLTPQEMLKDGQVEAAKSKFMYQYDINGIDAEGNTVLHLAAQMNDPDLITFFIIKGADPELKNHNGDTPLHVAIKNESYEAARTLAATGGNLFARDADGITALDLGLSSNNLYYDLFITTKAGQIRDVEGQTIVHYFVKTKNLQGIRKCIEKQLPISVKDDKGKTPLDIAFDDIDDYDSVVIAAELIQGGATEIETDFSYFQDAIAARNLTTALKMDKPLSILQQFTDTMQSQPIFWKTMQIQACRTLLVLPLCTKQSAMETSKLHVCFLMQAQTLMQKITLEKHLFS